MDHPASIIGNSQKRRRHLKWYSSFIFSKPGACLAHQPEDGHAHEVAGAGCGAGVNIGDS